MAAELLIASNPGKRRRKMSKAQRAAALRNLRKARAARGHKKRRRHNPTAVARPRKRRRHHVTHVRRRRHNPSFRLGGFSGLTRKVMPALIGGAGAVGNDLLYSMAINALPANTPMLDQFKTGYLRHLGKAASAVLLGYGARMVVGRSKADQLVTGALIVVGYNVVKDVVMKVAPASVTANLGMYLNPGFGRLAYPGAGWNPGNDWRRKSGLAAYIPAGPTNTPGGVRVGSQFNSPGSFAMRATPMYQDEFEAGT